MTKWSESGIQRTPPPRLRGRPATTPDVAADDAHWIDEAALEPLDDSQASTITAELIGSHPWLSDLAGRIIERSAGNPFYVQEIVREYAERGVIVAERGAYQREQEVDDVSVPPTLQATIGARIDRLTAPAKRTLNAATSSDRGSAPICWPSCSRMPTVCVTLRWLNWSSLSSSTR
ncbi:hypothetical protein [Mycobacterium szulgai]|uniref:hypothetical protein n=1 Tax=Mycobacterium szulgai TaxID=1787 RepID=UPI00111C1D47|nr:hypothetical protein [Mycobacterium szulgai]MCV7078517.1 hypothetical protein [Mycobacterium szulgai]